MGIVSEQDDKPNIFWLKKNRERSVRNLAFCRQAEKKKVSTEMVFKDL